MKKGKCCYCQKSFVLSKSQTWKHGQGRNVFCRRECYTSYRGFNSGGYVAICKTCKKNFHSKYPNKIYCNMECYLTDPEAIRRLKTQLSEVHKRAREKGHGNVVVECAYCGKKKKIKKSHKLQRNFCNRIHYRKFMAERFDRWIASPQKIALPQNYDEFLTQEQLPCPVAGCQWEGKGLSAHANFEHGIGAERFKKMVGFNLHTGLVAPGTSKKMSNNMKARIESGYCPPGELPLPRKPREYVSLECKEHQKKSRAIFANQQSDRNFMCLQCGRVFMDNYFGRHLYCSIKCRNKYYYNRNKNKTEVRK